MPDQRLTKRGGLMLVAIGSIVLSQLVCARQIPVTLLHTANLSGQLDANPETLEGGLYRCAELIGYARKNARNSVLLDSGDFFAGSVLSDSGDGELILAAMRELKYDAIAPSSTDLAWGQRQLMEMPLVAANLAGFKPVVPVRMLRVDGIQIAVIGLTHPGLREKFPEEMMPGVSVSPTERVLRAVITSLRERSPEIIVLLANLGLADKGVAFGVKEIMQAFPEIDVVIGGQTGRKVVDVTYGGGLYTQAPRRGIGLGQVDLIWDTVQRKIISREAKVWRAGKNFLPNGSLMRVVRDAEAKSNALAEIELACSFESLGKHLVKSLSVDVVLLEEVVSSRFPSENQTLGSLLEWVGGNRAWYTVSLAGSELRDILDAARESGWVGKREGMVCGVHVDGDTGRLRYQGKPLNARKRLRIGLPHTWFVEVPAPLASTQYILSQPISQRTLTDRTLHGILRALPGEKGASVPDSDEKK